MHIGIIPDGNRRYAQKKGLSLSTAYRAGYDRLRDILYALLDLGVEYVSIYAMSRDNCMKRSPPELTVLYSLIEAAVNDFRADEKLRDHGVRLRVFGDLELLPSKLSSLVKGLEEETRNRANHTLAVALCYSTRWEINSLPPGTRSFETLPPLDLVIRTGGRRRLSDFFMVNSSYAEIYFTDLLWPEFNRDELSRALEWFHSQERLFGG